MRGDAGATSPVKPFVPSRPWLGVQHDPDKAPVVKKAVVVSAPSHEDKLRVKRWHEDKRQRELKSMKLVRITIRTVPRLLSTRASTGSQKAVGDVRDMCS